jgi:CBS domain containing-hemolysin-like protein
MTYIRGPPRIQDEEAQQQEQEQRRRTLSETTSTAPTLSSGWSLWWYLYVPNILAVVLCITVAAMAAGLTLGMLGLDPLLLLIKERAADSMVERQAAAQLLPIVRQHHRLLVTLLLLNAVANEALPLFLEALVPPPVAVVLSVTFVLFFGEIIPSAIFTGPNQIRIAHSLVPLVRLVLWLLYPIAGPIAALLDRLLHHHHHDADDDDDDNDDGNKSTTHQSASFTRGELAALIRIQYEERVAMKRKMKQRKKRVTQNDSTTLSTFSTSSASVQVVGALDFTPRQILMNAATDRQSIRALKNQVERNSSSSNGTVTISTIYENDTVPPRLAPSNHVKNNGNTGSDPVLVPPVPMHLPYREESSDELLYTYTDTQVHDSNRDHDVRWHDHSIHRDEVMMMEGALQMQTKVALDVYTPVRRVFSIPSNMKLNERNIVKIYASGYSRIPVHLPDHKTAIIGILVTKHLIVVDPKEDRPVYTLPLRTPRCVSPSMPLVDVLNMFQSGGHASWGGHLALVCARPSVGEQVFLGRTSLASSSSSSLVDANDTTATAATRAMTATSRAVLPETAGWMGIITLEDVLEMLLQEQIYDEMDKREQKALKIIVQAIARWRRYVQRKKKMDATIGNVPLAHSETTTSEQQHHPEPKILSIIEQAIANVDHHHHHHRRKEGMGNTMSTDVAMTEDTETTALLSQPPTTSIHPTYSN